jgi:hypothetical protein
MSFRIRSTDMGFFCSLDTRLETVMTSDSRYESVLAFVQSKSQDESELRKILFPPPPEKILAAIDGIIVKKDGVFFCTESGEREQLHGAVVEKIMGEIDAGAPATTLIKFLNRLYANPSRSSRERLYEWLKHRNLPITSEGKILCYKSVGADFYSIHAGKEVPLVGTVRSDGRIYNGVGETITIARRAVDDNPNNTCSYGLHVGSWDYVSDFGGAGSVRLLVEVDPADIVSVPTDCNAQKVRCCSYKVLEVIDGVNIQPDSLGGDRSGYRMDLVDSDDDSEEWYEDDEDEEIDDVDQSYDAGFEAGREAALAEIRERLGNLVV